MRIGRSPDGFSARVTLLVLGPAEELGDRQDAIR